jgi:hypothetical protein
MKVKRQVSQNSSFLEVEKQTWSESTSVKQELVQFMSIESLDKIVQKNKTIFDATRLSTSKSVWLAKLAG